MNYRIRRKICSACGKNHTPGRYRSMALTKRGEGAARVLKLSRRIGH